jgi:myo-inositol-1(or 4)-monophosphatase
VRQVAERQVAELAARAGGQVLIERFDALHNVRSKGFRDIVTDADVAAQDAIVSVIRQHFPEHGLLSEENLSTGGDGKWVWVIDPLDGTVNYSRCIPCFAVSIALIAQGEPTLGVVFDPLHNRLFAAERGAGANLNGQPLHVSTRAHIAQAVVGLDWARDPVVRGRVLDSLNRVAPQAGTVRAIGSAALALCYVAAGWLDAYFHLALQAWDQAAAGLIIRQAGGTITDPSGAAWSFTTPGCVASNGLIHSAVLELIHANVEIAGTG